MDNFTFWSPTKFVFGRDTEEKTGELAAQFGGKRVMIVYGGGSVVRSGLLDRVKKSLEDKGLTYVELGGIKPNPTDDRVYEGIDIARREHINMLVAVGGGSTIDTAKAIACGVPYEGDFWDFYCGRKIVEKALPVGVVLTIPAAGSEGSGNSVITKLDGLVKLSLRTESALRPCFAVMNPALTFTLPPYQTACGITDMMAHIFERYFTTTPACEVTDSVAEGLLRTIMQQGKLAYDQPDNYDARANVMWAGTLAHNGICGTGRREDWASHFMEHEISAIYGVAHGAGLAVVIPAWMNYVAHRNPSKVAQFARNVMGVAQNESDLATAIEGIQRLRAFLRSIGMPATFSDMGIEQPDIDRMVQMLHLHKGNPIGGYQALSPDDTRAIYQSMK
ncbi:MAG: iron-containing alcohol dehydrogenase [Muribaculum sp.]|nr:iron-containing alcohol dehydrogenase [Muribaculaceae bacterium]MCM1081121.1 iron-containing alcohol dehydrogenase [Muribaculum sp.]